jgi:hypothetical protein
MYKKLTHLGMGPFARDSTATGELAPFRNLAQI